MIKEEEIAKALDVLSLLNTELRFSKICEIDQLHMNTYKVLLEEFERLNNISANSINAPKNLHNLKGEALEKLVRFLLKISGNIFTVYSNLRTSTNEIDDLISLTPKGKTLLSWNLINKQLDNCICECKNYDKPLSVTYIGKFCSLLLTNNIRLGILFSYNGVTGKDWQDGAGLIKKFYICKENLDDRFCIVNFTIKEFRAILNGKNLLEIIDEQIKSLQLDTDFSRYISTHPAEK